MSLRSAKMETSLIRSLRSICTSSSAEGVADAVERDGRVKDWPHAGCSRMRVQVPGDGIAMLSSSWAMARPSSCRMACNRPAPSRTCSMTGQSSSNWTPRRSRLRHDAGQGEHLGQAASPLISQAQFAGRVARLT